MRKEIYVSARWHPSDNEQEFTPIMNRILKSHLFTECEKLSADTKCPFLYVILYFIINDALV